MSIYSRERQERPIPAPFSWSTLCVGSLCPLLPPLSPELPKCLPSGTEPSPLRGRSLPTESLFLYFLMHMGTEGILWSPLAARGTAPSSPGPSPLANSHGRGSLCTAPLAAGPQLARCPWDHPPTLASPQLAPPLPPLQGPAQCLRRSPSCWASVGAFHPL